ncbi:type II secretion system protein [Oleiharenicola lentus]|uniref:type II secretion system protein n=1 Tax=Oleiharenicola lentus TaxID=2508720 RepID=UPI003F67B1FD
MNIRSNKGFTLVEIMIVVVIIGLLAAMAIPAFQKVRTNSIGKAMENDARQIASAAQQYILDNAGQTTVTVSANTQDGVIATTSPVAEYVKKISKGTTVGNYNGTVTGTNPAFSMSNPQLGSTSVGFDAEGKKL